MIKISRCVQLRQPTFQCLFGACKTSLSVRPTFLPVHLAEKSMTCFLYLLQVLMTASLLQTSVVLAQDVLTITTSDPYVFNGTLQYDLTCTVRSLKAMTFRWEGIYCNQREKLVGSDRCQFTPSQSNNGKIVMCIATYVTNGSSSEISNITTLNVQYPPSEPPHITSNVVGGTMFVGHDYYMICTISGGNPLPSIIFGCIPPLPTHQGVNDWRGVHNSSMYSFKPAVLGDHYTYCKCTGYWSPFPALYQLNATCSWRSVDNNGSTVLPINRTTLAEITSSLSSSETLTFTTKTSSMTSSETPIRDIAPDDNFKSNVFIGLGIIGALLLICIIIGVIGIRMFLNTFRNELHPDTAQSESHIEDEIPYVRHSEDGMREDIPEQNGAAPGLEPNLRAFAESGHNYDSISSLKSERSSLPLYNSEITPAELDPQNELYLTAVSLNI